MFNISNLRILFEKFLIVEEEEHCAISNSCNSDILIKKWVMAFQHAVVFFTLILIWLVLINAQQSPLARREIRYPHIRSPQIRPTRDLEKHFNNMPLGTSRMYGKRATTNNSPLINNFLLEWIAFETRLRNLGIPKEILDADDVLPE